MACLWRGELQPETLSLTLAEGKALLASIQETLVAHQATAYVEQQRSCPVCGQRQGHKDTHVLVYRTLFGKLHIASPCLYTCACRPQGKRSFSPLATFLLDRTAPELLYLQSK